MEGKPSGALAYFAPAQKYTMLNPGSPPKPVKTVTYDKQKDKTSVSVPDMEQTFVFSCKTVIPPGYQPAYYFKSMILTDKLEDCLTTSLKDISVANENGKSLTHLFDLTLNGQTVQAKAKAGSAGLGNSALYNGGGGESLNDIPKIERRYGECDVTITFKGSNPKLKENLLSLLCDSFEERVMNSKSQKEDTKESE